MQTRSKLEKKADNALSKYIRAKYPYCVCCGTTENLTNGHIFSRSFMSVRFDESNCLTQCVHCNWLHEEKPEIFESIAAEYIGKDKLERLRIQKNKLALYSHDDLIEIEKKYKNKLKELL